MKEISRIESSFWKYFFDACGGNTEDSQFLKRKDIIPLIEIFKETDMWANAWLYTELGCCNQWKEKIEEGCCRAMEKLEGNESQYAEFMYLYCKSILTEMRYRDKIGIMDEESQNDAISFLGECISYGKKNAWNVQSCLLAAKASKCHIITRKHALDFYKRAAMQEKSAEIFYELGREYEKNIGSGIEFFREAYKLGSYRGAYQVVHDYNRKGRYRDMIFLSEKMAKELGPMIPKCISVRDMEFYYRFCICLIEGYDHFIGCDDIVRAYKEEVTRLQKNAVSCFDELAHKMMPGEEKKFAKCIEEKIIPKMHL